MSESDFPFRCFFAIHKPAHLSDASSLQLPLSTRNLEKADESGWALAGLSPSHTRQLTTASPAWSLLERGAPPSQLPHSSAGSCSG